MFGFPLLPLLSPDCNQLFKFNVGPGPIFLSPQLYLFFIVSFGFGGLHLIHTASFAVQFEEPDGILGLKAASSKLSIFPLPLSFHPFGSILPKYNDGISCCFILFLYFVLSFFNSGGQLNHFFHFFDSEIAILI